MKSTREEEGRRPRRGDPGRSGAGKSSGEGGAEGGPARLSFRDRRSPAGVRGEAGPGAVGCGGGAAAGAGGWWSILTSK